jgi:hypothetical protein
MNSYAAFFKAVSNLHYITFSKRTQIVYNDWLDFEHCSPSFNCARFAFSYVYSIVFSIFIRPPGGKLTTCDVLRLKLCLSQLYHILRPVSSTFFILFYSFAGVTGLEPAAYGFGDRCSTN